MARRGGLAAAARRVAPPLPEVDWKQLQQTRVTKTTPAEKEVVPEDGEGAVGYLPGYVPTGVDR